MRDPGGLCYWTNRSVKIMKALKRLNNFVPSVGEVMEACKRAKEDAAKECSNYEQHAYIIRLFNPVDESTIRALHTAINNEDSVLYTLAIGGRALHACTVPDVVANGDSNTLFMLYLLFAGTKPNDAVKHLNREFINGVKVSNISDKVITIFYTSNSTDNNISLAADLENDCYDIKEITCVGCDDYEMAYGPIDPDNQVKKQFIYEEKSSLRSIDEDRLIDFIRKNNVTNNIKSVYYLSKQSFDGQYSVDMNLFKDGLSWDNVNSILYALGAENMAGCILSDVAISKPEVNTNFMYFNIKYGSKESLHKFLTMLFLIENCLRVIVVNTVGDNDVILYKCRVVDSPQISCGSDLDKII